MYSILQKFKMLVCFGLECVFQILVYFFTTRSQKDN